MYLIYCSYFPLNILKFLLRHIIIFSKQLKKTIIGFFALFSCVFLKMACNGCLTSLRYLNKFWKYRRRVVKYLCDDKILDRMLLERGNAFMHTQWWYIHKKTPFFWEFLTKIEMRDYFIETRTYERFLTFSWSWNLFSYLFLISIGKIENKNNFKTSALLHTLLSQSLSFAWIVTFLFDKVEFQSANVKV